MFLVISSEKNVNLNQVALSITETLETINRLNTTEIGSKTTLKLIQCLNFNIVHCYDGLLIRV